MSNLFDEDPEEQNAGEIESPADGPPPDWMRTATSATGGSSFNEDNAPDWLKNIRAGKEGRQAPEASQADEDASEGEPATNASEDETGAESELSDLERLLAEEGIDLTGVGDERPEGS
jgi:hypothetical protein